MGLNDTAWQKLFEQYRILDVIAEQGRFCNTRSRVKAFREPRLMTKFDHKVNLPAVFAENHLAILPITRGDYMISSFSAYQTFETPSSNAKTVSLPSYIQSLMPQFLVSESIALNCANACGILQDFLEDSNLVPTVSGRMGSGSFTFRIRTEDGWQTVAVNNAQIEIDAAYEGAGCLSLFEAKRDLSEDFLIRQLYYPFRVWSNRITKPIKPVFFIFSNGMFFLYEYQFEDPQNYNSLRLIKQKNYRIATGICVSDIEKIFMTIPLQPEPPISFPQANNMLRIINLAELLHEKPMTRQEITTQYAFDERQTNYYTDAGRYLGLIEKGRDENNRIAFRLSKLGHSLMGLTYKERQLGIVAQILKHQVFRDTLKLCWQCGQMPDTQTVVRIMKQSNLYHVEADSTFVRRSSTIIGWLHWILSLIKE